jgi:fructose-specific phosphotransferase system component IIB
LLLALGIRKIAMAWLLAVDVSVESNEFTDGRMVKVVSKRGIGNGEDQMDLYIAPTR